MPLELYTSASFHRSIRKLGTEQREVVAHILEALNVYYASEGSWRGSEFNQQSVTSRR